MARAKAPKAKEAKALKPKATQTPATVTLVEHAPIISDALIWQKPKACTPEMFERICDRVSDGESLGKIAKDREMPARLIIRRYIASSEANQAMYALAREDRADTRGEQMDDIISEIKNGTLEPNAARVILDGLKWQMSKEKPRTYGDKLDLTAKLTVSHEDALEQLK